MTLQLISPDLVYKIYKSLALLDESIVTMIAPKQLSYNGHTISEYL